MNEAYLLRAVLDSCVLYPPGLRSLFMWLVVQKAFVPKWSNQIHEEWISNALEDDAKRNPLPKLSREKLERTRALMDENAEESNVTDYERHIPTVLLPDPEDRHVVAVAIESETEIIVTFNLRDFPPSALSPHGIVSMHPDEFLCDLLDEEPGLFWEAIEQLRTSLKKPPMSTQELCQRYHKLGLTRLAERLMEMR
jgi:predicted nucleic acid-binding protein